MRLEQVDIDEWGELLPRSGFEIFHTPEALAVLDEHADASLRLYGVFKGQEAVGLFPAFVRSHRVGRTVTSPPPSMTVPRLGPLVMPASPKQRKRESVTWEAVDLFLEELDLDATRTLFHLQCPLAYEDPRPFQWSDLRVEQAFTYVLDLSETTPEAVRDGFSRDLRKELRQRDDADISVSIEGDDAAGLVYDDVAGRYAEQEETFPVERAFFRDIIEALGDRCRVYVARDATGEYLSGLVVLYSNDTASFWQGGVRASQDGISVNSVLHWAVISDMLSDEGPDVSGYDLVGANTPRLCRYKSKFGADLVPYYTVESSGTQMSVAKRAYSLVNR
jgi:hypothetical protein